MTVIVYEGGFDGFLSAVFEGYRRRHDVSILPLEVHDGMFLTESVRVSADEAHARRVERGMCRVCREAPEVVYRAWLSHEEGMEDDLYLYIRLLFDTGQNPRVRRQLPYVRRVLLAARRVGWEVHRYMQFVRFIRVREGLYAADIEPDYDILHLLIPHFTARFADQRFVIRDLRHARALVYDLRRTEIRPLPPDAPRLPADDQIEGLWQRYFSVLCIPQRRNLKLQAQFVPHRYRRHLTEMKKRPLL